MQATQFERWEFKTTTDTDGVTWHWARFWFRDDEGELYGDSPMYAEEAPDFYCLLEDATKVAVALREGKAWDELSITFRQSG